MGEAPQPASVKHTHDAINQSRNERQKSVLLIEVAHQILATTSRLIEEGKELMAHTKGLHQGIRNENRRR